jgi:cell division protein FtsI (penicillin-binding protein 3)
LQRRTRRVRTPRFTFRAGQAQRRLRFVFVVTILLFALVLGRVVWLQTVKAKGLQAAGKDQRTSETAVKAMRGTIFSRDGDELALSVPTTTLIANPKLVVDAAGTVSVVGAMLQLSAEKQVALLNAFTEKKKSFVYIARQLDDDLADSVLALGLPGVEGYRESKRILPTGDVGRSVIGRTDIDGLGIAGVERQFDDQLTGEDGESVRQRDRDGNTIAGAEVTAQAPIPGDDLQLTIDRSLQFQVEQALLTRVSELSAKGGVVIVMDTATGEIYAMANVERRLDGVVEVTSANLAAVVPFEPGSVAKVFSISAAINEGAVTRDTTLEVPGKVVFDEGTDWEKTITDAEPHGTQPMTVRDILVHSSNIGTWKSAQKIGSERLGDYLGAFGFGSMTGLDFPDESAGQIKAASEWQGTEKVTVTYGYGYSATAVQLAAAVNAIANHGTYVAPKLLLSRIDERGTMVPTPPSSTREVVSAETAATMTSLMTDVVCDGTGSRAQLPDISVAGKTGTAYKVQENNTYEGDAGERAYRASFVGFLPAADPKITVLVSIDEPDPTTKDRFGGTAAAPLFTTVAEAAILELRISPTPGDTGCPNAG